MRIVAARASSAEVQHSDRALAQEDPSVVWQRLNGAIDRSTVLVPKRWIWTIPPNSANMPAAPMATRINHQKLHMTRQAGGGARNLYRSKE